MHRLPKFFHSHNSKSKQMESKSQPTTPTRPKPKSRPKLDRRNAAKNIEYDPNHSSSGSNFFASSSASTSSYSPDDSFAMRTRSIDVYPWDDRTSFRINGKEEGQLEFYCKSLGLNGPEDLGISADDFRVMKARGGELASQSSSFGISGVEVGAGDAVNNVTIGIERSRSDDVSGSVCVVDDYRVMKARCGKLLSQASNFVNVGGVEVEVEDGVSVDSSGSNVSLGVHRSRGGGVNASVTDVSGQVSTFVSVSGVEVEGDGRVSSVILGIGRSRGSGFSASNDDVRGQVATYVDVNGVEVEGDDRVNNVMLDIDPSRCGGVNDSVGVKLCAGVLGNGELCREVVEDLVVLGIHEGEGVKVVLSGERRGGVRIKGERPAALLTPPPGMALPVIDDFGSSWDILKSFGPKNDSIARVEDEQGESSSEEDVVEEDDDVVKRERTVGQGSGLLSESCSVTSNSNDDDDSSTTTDPMSISPNGILRRPIPVWEKGKRLGSGSYGTVYEGLAPGGFFFAVKEVSLLDQGDRGREIIFQLEQEMAFLSRFEHNNIVRYYGTDKDDSNLYIFLELVPQGSLLSLYQRIHLRDSHVSGFTRQILEGLKYLHDHNVVHRDIKCANILVDVEGKVKLADFGLAKVDKLNDAKSCKGTPYWMAPEVVQPNRSYGRPADIWSLGCTVLEMLTRNFPYHPFDGIQAMYRIGSGQPPSVPDSLSREARDFILNCLHVDPDTRPSAAELLEHPYVKVTNL